MRDRNDILLLSVVYSLSYEVNLDGEMGTLSRHLAIGNTEKKGVKLKGGCRRQPLVGRSGHWLFGNLCTVPDCDNPDALPFDSVKETVW